MFYVTKTGCGREWLPREFPQWKTVYHYFPEWRLRGLWQTIHTILRQMVREAAGRNAQPSAAIIDSQSVESTYVGGSEHLGRVYLCHVSLTLRVPRPQHPEAAMLEQQLVWQKTERHVG
jgi:transposase